MPLFTVVIPAYNAEKYIRRCVDSVLCQSFKDFEVVVVNNYSQDNTEAILRGYTDSRFHYYNEHNHGIIAHSRNFGVSHAKGDWICFLDADDWWGENKLLEVSECIPFYDVVYHKLLLKGTYNSLMHKTIGRRLYKKGNLYEELVINGNIAPTSSITVRKELFLKAGKMSESVDLVGVEDSDCWFRIARLSDKWKFINKSLGCYYIGSNTSLSIRQIEKEKSLLEKHIGNLSEQQQIEAYKTLLYKQARLYHKLGLYLEAASYYRKSFTFSRFFETVIFVCDCIVRSPKKK